MQAGEIAQFTGNHGVFGSVHLFVQRHFLLEKGIGGGIQAHTVVSQIEEPEAPGYRWICWEWTS